MDGLVLVFQSKNMDHWGEMRWIPAPPHRSISNEDNWQMRVSCGPLCGHASCRRSSIGICDLLEIVLVLRRAMTQAVAPRQRGTRADFWQSVHMNGAKSSSLPIA